MITLSKIFVYPIKAMPGVQLNVVSITEGGTLNNDRRWAIVDDSGRLVNGKNNKRVFFLRPSFNLSEETVSFSDGGGSKDVFSLADIDSLSDYFTEQLGKRVFVKEDKRQGFPDDMKASGPTVVSQKSLEAVASWYPNLTLDDVRARFRINLEAISAPAFWEDSLFQKNEQPKVLHIGDVSIHASNPCARCSVPTKHPQSGASYNNFYEMFIRQREKSKPNWTDPAYFDHWYRLSVNTNIRPEQTGKTISLGDTVSLSS